MIHRTLLPLISLLFVSASSLAQHDAQRDAAQAVARGNRESFTKAFRDPKVDAGVAETEIVNLLMLLAEDRVDEALSFARSALESGLDPARLLTGAGEPWNTLRNHPDFDSLPGIADVGELIHGPMVGSVTDSEAVIWARTKEEQEVTGFLFIAGTENDKIEGKPVAIQTRASDDFTGVLRFGGLRPNTEYLGRLVCNGDESASFTFRTRPRSGESAKFSIAFGGGAGFVPEYHRMWETISSFDPDGMLMLGDNVYIDDPENELTQRYCYYRRQSEPKWRGLMAHVPILSIYDDHDFGDNDCMPGPEIEEPEWKRSVLEIFRQNWANPGYGGGEENPGCWYDFSIGDVQFFMIDGRYYRHRPSGSMLGPVQKKWLLDGLAESQATFKIICSNVPFTPDVKPGSKDTWDGYPDEREEIFSFLERERIEGVFLVSADRHRTDLRYIERPNGYRLYEFMSSRLTNRHTHPVVKTPGLVWGYRDTCSFGLMDFDTTAEDPKVTFRCIDIDGKERHRFDLALSELKWDGR